MRGIVRILCLLGMLTLVGTGWFALVSGWSIVDAFYMTIITLSTVGYAEVRVLSDADKVFVSCFLIVGLGVFMYGIIQLGETVVRAELGQWWRKRHMTGAINALENHFVVCGSGRMGTLVCEELSQRRVPFVVIDQSPSVIERCHDAGWAAMCGDATDDSSLIEAGIERAAGVAAILESDADNLYVVVSSRIIRQDVQIVARAHDEASARKLLRAGANRVVSPYASGAAKMSQLLTNPRLNEFIEVIADRDVAFDLVGLPISSGSIHSGKRLDETDFRDRGVMIVAVRRENGEMILAPSGSTQIKVGDELFALGDTESIRQIDS